jgi:hypothetical protein
VAGLGDRLLDYIEGELTGSICLIHQQHVPLHTVLCARCVFCLISLQAKSAMMWNCVYICTGGPKLRRWYGQGERPTDGGGMQRGSEPAPQVDPDAPRDSVLVTDADSPTGDAVVLQLILAGCAMVAACICVLGVLRLVCSASLRWSACQECGCAGRCRAKIRVLVRNAQQAVTGYGSYVTPITGDAGNQVSGKMRLPGDATCNSPAC